jgi:CRP-like cAMP-binding protein
VRDAAAGEQLVGEGAHGYLFFVVGAGEVAVTVGRERVATLGPGDFFGEIALLGYRHHVATVTTTSPSQVLVLFGRDFERMRTRFPAIAEEIDAAMRQRLDELPA